MCRDPSNHADKCPSRWPLPHNQQWQLAAVSVLPAARHSRQKRPTQTQTAPICFLAMASVQHYTKHLNIQESWTVREPRERAGGRYRLALSTVLLGKKIQRELGMTCTSIDAGDQPSHKYTTNPSLPRSTAGNTPNVPTHQDTTPNRLSTLSWVAWVNPPVGLPRHNTTIRHKAACASPNQQAVGDGAARRAQEPRGRSRPSSA